MPTVAKILVVEDDPNIAELLGIHFTDAGYEMAWSADGSRGLEKFLADDYALVILDVMLPGLDGLEVCKRIREQNKYTPILILTSKSEEVDKILGLELGADDYITKPFSIRELMTRIKVIFRRMEADKQAAQQSDGEDDELKFGDLKIIREKRKVLLAGQNVELTAREFDLLVQFAAHPGRAYSRKELLDLVWGYNFDGYEHTVNSHINRLRSKIEPDPSQHRYIKTVWGVGYSFAEQEQFEA